MKLKIVVESVNANSSGRDVKGIGERVECSGFWKAMPKLVIPYRIFRDPAKRTKLCLREPFAFSKQPKVVGKQFGIELSIDKDALVDHLNPSLASEHKRPLVFPPVVAARHERVVPYRHRAVYRNVGGLSPLCVPPTEISRIGERGALRLVGSRVDDLGELDVQDMLFPRHLEQHLVIAFCEIRIRVLGERREHSLVVHVMSEYHRVVRFEPLSLTACIEVRATVDVVLPVNVVMKIVLRIG